MGSSALFYRVKLPFFIGSSTYMKINGRRAIYTERLRKRLTGKVITRPEGTAKQAKMAHLRTSISVTGLISGTYARGLPVEESTGIEGVEPIIRIRIRQAEKT